MTARVLPGRFKLLGGLTKSSFRKSFRQTPTVGRVLGKVHLGRAEVNSVLGGTAGAGAGSVTYTMLK